jgi:hypothetical protein
LKKNEELGEQREAWHRLATRCAARIRERCGTTLDKEAAEKIARVFRAALVPRKKAGRKPDCETVRAAKLWVRHSKKKHLLKREQRQLWQRIYREVIPGYARLDKLTRQYRTILLRRNVKAYLNRKKRAANRRAGFATPHQSSPLNV